MKQISGGVCHGDLVKKYRNTVNGSVSNMPAFYKVFNVEPADPIHIPDSLRVKIR
jgi:predicted metalloendopeptidase